MIEIITMSISILTIIGLVDGQFQPNDYCPIDNLNMNSLLTDGDLVFVFINDTFTTFQLDHRDRPEFGMQSNETWFQLSNVTLKLPKGCARYATIKNYSGVELINRNKLTRSAHINVRFRKNEVKRCPKLDTIFYLNTKSMVYEPGLEGYQELVYTQYFESGFDVSPNIAIVRNLENANIEETRILIKNSKDIVFNVIHKSMRLPTSMAILSNNNQTRELKMVYVYDNLLYTIADIGYDEKIINPMITSTNWYSVNKLIGCASNLCLDGQLDAADYDGSNFFFQTGAWIWKMPSLDNATLTTPYERSERAPISAITSTKDYTFEIHEHFIVVLTIVDNSLKRIRGQFGKVDAAFSVENHLVIISGQSMKTYNYTGHEFFNETLSEEAIISKWTHVFEFIETAMVVHDTIYFTINSFFVKAPLNGGRSISEPNLIQNQWFSCDNSVYRKMVNSWNVANFTQYRQFMFRYRPEVDQTITKSSTKVPSTSSTVIVVICLSAVLLATIIALILFINKRRSRSSSAGVGTPLGDANTTNAPNTVGNIGNANTSLSNVNSLNDTNSLSAQ